MRLIGRRNQFGSSMRNVARRILRTYQHEHREVTITPLIFDVRAAVAFMSFTLQTAKAQVLVGRNHEGFVLGLAVALN